MIINPLYKPILIILSFPGSFDPQIFSKQYEFLKLTIVLVQYGSIATEESTLIKQETIEMI